MLNIHGSLVNSNPACEDLVWNLDSVPLVCVFISVSVPYYFDYYSFVVQCEIRICDVSGFFFPSQDCFSHMGYSVVPYRL